MAATSDTHPSPSVATWTSKWTSVSQPGSPDYGFRGWVATEEEAFSIKESFEKATSVKYIIEKTERYTSQSRDDAQNPAKALQQRIRFADASEGVVPNEGVPFITASRTQMTCMYGRDKHAKFKARAQEEKHKCLKEGTPTRKYYRKLKPSRKRGCPAVILIKEVIRFVDFKVKDGCKQWQERKSSRGIRDCLARDLFPRWERRFYVRLPLDADHQETHSVGQTVFKEEEEEEVAADVAEPVVLVHGGAWSVPDALVEASCEGVVLAARAGLRVLDGAGTAVDAVQAAVCVLEDDPAFEAGTGSVLNEDGDVETDAIVMEGRRLRTGAVACLKNIRHPVRLARLVMDQTEHILLVGDGAKEFARTRGIEEMETGVLITEEARRELETFKKFHGTANLSTRDHDTVGAVAIDREGNVACATSTGGVTSKTSGRVRDSPLIGSGVYCDNAVGTASTTGYGQSIAKVTLARQVVYNMQNGDTAQEAVENALAHMSDRVGGAGGTVAINRAGDVGVAFTAQRMPWAWAKARDGPIHYGINPGEDLTVAC